MHITSKMTANRYIKKVRDKFKKGIVLDDVLLGTSMESLEEMKKANPALLCAAVDYIKLAEQKVQEGYIPPQVGKSGKSSPERKRLEKAFSCDTKAKIELFRQKPFGTIYDSLPYQLLEATFDASLMLEPLAEKRFKEMWSLYNSFVEVYDGDGKKCFLSAYGGNVLLIRPSKGKVYRLPASCYKKNPIKGIDYEVHPRGINGLYLQYKDTVYSSLLWDDDYKRFNRNFTNCSVLKDKQHKLYYQVVVKNQTDTASAIRFNVHTLLILATQGLDVAKHLILKDSLITVDHVDGVGNHNSLYNLELVTRRDNKLRAVAKDDEVMQNVCSYDFTEFFEFIKSCFRMNKHDVEDILWCNNYTWKDKLKVASAESLLLA